MTELPPPVLLDVSPDGVAVLTLNRPAHGNGVDELLIAGMADALETLKGADHVRIVVLRGAGDDFCTGADHEWIRRQEDRDAHENEADMVAYGRVLKALHDLPQFSVALVQGRANGGGAGMVAACDWAAAAPDATFRLGEVRIGLMPALAGPYVIEAIGPRAARGLFASAQIIDARRAYELGLVQEVVASEAALQGVMKRLAGLATENAPGAVAAAKQIVRDFAGKPITEGVTKETAKRLAEQRLSEEGREGAAALLGKRPPSWDAGQR